jgi:hypothetical protein
MQVVNKIYIFLLAAFLLNACKKENNNSNQSRLVKYEIAGNYSGKLTVVYADETGVLQTVTNVSLPWSKSFTTQAAVQSVAFNASTTSTAVVGVAGQTATAKLFIDSAVVKSNQQTADATGRIQFSSLVYVF